MYPKWLYIFNHWLWVAALGFLALLVFFTVAIVMPFNKFFSYEFICWFADDFLGWAIAGAMAAFAIGTGVCTQYVGEEIHKQRIENERKERENKKEE